MLWTNRNVSKAIKMMIRYHKAKLYYKTYCLTAV